MGLFSSRHKFQAAYWFKDSYPVVVSHILGLAAKLLTRSPFAESMDAPNLTDDSGYKKWRFQAEGEPSRSTLWRRNKLKRRIVSNQEDELCDNGISQHQPDFQDQDACKHVRGATSKLQSGTEVSEMIQSDSSCSSFSDHFCLGKCRFYSFQSRTEHNR